MQQAFSDIAHAGYGKVPGQVEFAALDARLLQLAEHRLHGRTALLDGSVVGQGVVAKGAEHLGRRQQVTVAVPQVAQRNNVALAALELHHRADDERLFCRVIGVGVKLGEHQVLLTGAGADHHHRRIRRRGSGQIGNQRGAGLRQVHIRNLCENHLRRREAVIAVPLAGVHPVTTAVGGH